jgi:flagellar assembly factor FliW
MKFETTRFGELECPDDVIMTFPGGVLGFPEQHRYILLEHDIEGSPFRWLQALDSADLAFIVVDPVQVDPEFSLDVDADTARIIGSDQLADCALMSIVNVPHDQPIRMTANLKAPLLVNVASRIGRQMVLSNNRFSLSARIFPDQVAPQPAPKQASANPDVAQQAVS